MKNKHVTECEILDRQIFITNSSRTDFRKELKKNNAEYFIIVMENKNYTDLGNRFLNLVSKSFFQLIDFFIFKTTYKIVGYVGLWYILQEAHIVSIGVDVGHRNCGLGKFLMIAAIESAINKNSEVVTLEVRVSNYAAQKLYSKFGFNKEGIRKNYYLDDREDALIMTTNSILNLNYQNFFYKLYKDQLEIYKDFS